MRFNRSSRAYRLVVGFISPPLIGTFLALTIGLAHQLFTAPRDFASIASAFLYFPIVLLGAVMFVGIQSLLFSLVMEFVVRSRVPGRRGFLAAAGGLGLLAALVPAVYIDAPELFLPLGVVVGVAVGWLVFDREQQRDA